MSGKSAIVTGGAQGIGKAISRVLLKHGYRVAILDVNETAGKQTAEEFSSQFGSGSCVFYKCDVTKTEQLHDCYAQIEETLGYVVVVVNNAGFFDNANPKKLVNVNLCAVIELSELAVNRMRKDTGGHGGTIVNVASSTALWSSFPGLTSYVATKWGVLGFTKSMAASIALAEQDWGISIMALCPKVTAVERFGKGPMQLSSAIPRAENVKVFQDRVKGTGVYSLEEIAEAFEKLFLDNKNGAVMRCTKEKDGAPVNEYVEHSWSVIN